MRIIYVEDHDDLRTSFTRNFEDEGATMLTFAHADQALDAIPEFNPEGIITDFDLGPRYMNGIGFVKKVREMGLTIPIVMLSGSDQRYLREQLEGLDVLCVDKMERKNIEKTLAHLGHTS